MGLQSALSTALTGMNAAETTIDVVGNNVANSNTVGFKESEAIFATQFLQTHSLGSAPTPANGGTNPRQIGLGTQVAEIAPDFTQGTIEISSNPLDMAIQGDGFFIVQGSQGELLYTRNGQFRTNAQNELVTVNGQRVLGYGVDDNFQVQPTGLVPISIPLGTAAVAEPTENVFLEGNLIPTGDIGDTPGIIQSPVLSSGTYEIPPNLSSADITALAPPVVSGATLASDPSAGGLAGDYAYRIVFVDTEGNEGPPSASLGPLNVTGGAGDQAILLDNLPTADGVDFVARRLYRTDGTGTGDYQLVTQLDATQSSYVDTTSDVGLGASLAADTLAPANYSYHVTFYNTVTGLESLPTALIGPVNIGANGMRVRMENLPQPTTTDFDAIRIYRNLSSDSSQYYRLAELPAGTTSYIDGAPDAAIEVSGNEISLDGPGIDYGTRLVDLVSRDGSTYTNPFQEGTLSFAGTKGGRTLAAKELEITSTTTVSDLISFMNEAMGIQESPGPDPNFPIPGSPGGEIVDNRIQFTSNMGVSNELGVGLPAFRLSTGGGPAEAISLPFSSTQTANGEGAVTDFVVYDSLGIPLSVRLSTVLESRDGDSTTYRWFADSPDNDSASGVDIAVGTGTITFDGEGNMVSASESTVSIDRRNVASVSPLSFELDFSRISGLDGNESTLNASRQDGFGAGTLASFIVTESGRINGVFSNGVLRDLGQLRLARFTNNNGLEQLGDNLFATGVNSGLPLEGDPGSQGIGSVTAGAVELSNTDIGQNLIELILASTQYRGGTRVITTVQQLFDELLALRR